MKISVFIDSDDSLSMQYPTSAYYVIKTKPSKQKEAKIKLHGHLRPFVKAAVL